MPGRIARGLFLSYFAIFSGVLAAFVLAIHFAFVEVLKGEVSARLDTLLSAGIRSAHVDGDRINVKEDLSPTALLAVSQGLQWFDADRKLIANEGLVPDKNPLSAGEGLFKVGAHTLRTRSAAVVNSKTGTVIGWVRASQDLTRTRRRIWWLDEILIVGGLCALAASIVGSRYLQLRSVQPIRASYRRLQDFSAIASHELRGPVTAVKSNAEAALRDADGMRPPDRDRFESIAQAAQQMAKLTEDLLLLARADQPLEREMFFIDLSALIREVARLYRADFENHGVTLNDRIQTGTMVYGNPDQIQRIFANLLQNALRYTPRNGVVDIESSRHRGGVSVRVRDSGIGIAADQIDKVFDRFWRAEAARTRSSGTGLGLPIARALARRHGGILLYRAWSGAAASSSSRSHHGHRSRSFQSTSVSDVPTVRSRTLPGLSPERQGCCPCRRVLARSGQPRSFLMAGLFPRAIYASSPRSAATGFTWRNHHIAQVSRLRGLQALAS